MENKKRALGRGLEQLFNSENLDFENFEQKIYEVSTNEEIIEIPLNELRPNPYQPRKVFKDEALTELAESIKQNGVFQPIIVKRSIKGYDIVAGERRFRASKIAGLEKIPAIVRNFTDQQMIEIALLENLQRENLNVIEEALAYQKMIEKLNLTQEELSTKVSKSRSHITNILGLLRLPDEVQNMLINGEITMGHARVLSKLENTDQIITLANEIKESKIPVREVEKRTNIEDFERKIKIRRAIKEANKDFEYVENLLRDKLDTKIKINENKIEISFNNVADLNRILEILNVKE